MSIATNNKKWQQEDDAYTLSAAEAIKADPARMKGAAAAAKAMMAERQKQVQALAKIAAPAKKSTPSPRKTAPRSKK